MWDMTTSQLRLLCTVHCDATLGVRKPLTVKLLRLPTVVAAAAAGAAPVSSPPNIDSDIYHPDATNYRIPRSISIIFAISFYPSDLFSAIDYVACATDL